MSIEARNLVEELFTLVDSSFLIVVCPAQRKAWAREVHGSATLPMPEWFLSRSG